MVAKRSEAEPTQQLKQALAEFLQADADGPSVHDVDEGRLELHLSGTDAYMTRYTRRVMLQTHGAPFMAVETRTYKETKRVFIQPGKLGIKIPAGRRLILPLTPLDTPDHGVVYWASLVDVETEKRDVDVELAAAVKLVKAEKAKARKAARIVKHTGKPETGTGA
jgi:hypothetical protein